MTTTPTAYTKLPDLDHLEALARAADQGEGQHIYTNPRDSNGWQANEAWHLAPSPAAVLALIALARRAQPEGEAPQAEAKEVRYLLTNALPVLDREYRSLAHEVRQYLAKQPAVTLSPLCGAQHAESGEELVEKPAAYRVTSPNTGKSRLMHRSAMKAWERSGYIVTPLFERAALAAQQAAAPGALEWVNDVVRDVAELPDRDSPPGREDMMLVTVNELHDIIERHAPSAPGTPEAPQTAAARDVLAERQRQMQVEGWTLAHDDKYRHSELAHGAAAYALVNDKRTRPVCWPWAAEWWKPLDDRRNLVRAGALVLAEIERLDRAAAPKGGA